MIELARPFSFIFDMDGTLINTALATVAACQRCAPRFKLPVRQPSDITTLIGCHDAEFYRRLYPGYGADLLEEYALEVENDENDAMACMGGEILFEGAYELLSILCERRSYVSLASTGSESHVCAALSAGGISEFFKDVRCGSPDKTAMVKGIVENAPSGTWMIIGDRLADCTAGKANGIVTVAARYGFGNAGEYSEFDYGIERPLDLLKILHAVALDTGPVNRI